MKPAKDPIQEIIGKSGNDLQFKVAAYLEAQGWDVVLSAYYNDPITGKQRETDVIATRIIQINDGYGSRNLGDLKIRLFIECKYIKEPVIFWFRDKQTESVFKLVQSSGILDRSFDVEAISNPPQHHYLDKVQVAKNAAKGGAKDDFFDAMNQCLNGMVSYARGGAYTVDYPMIVTNSFENIYRRDESSESGYVPLPETFQLEVDYSYKEARRDQNPIDVTKYFLLDIVPIDGLGALLEDMEKRDIKTLSTNLRWKLVQSARAYQESRQRDNDYDPFSNDYF